MPVKIRFTFGAKSGRKFSALKRTSCAKAAGCVPVHFKTSGQRQRGEFLENLRLEELFWPIVKGFCRGSGVLNTNRYLIEHIRFLWIGKQIFDGRSSLRTENQLKNSNLQLFNF